MKILFSLSISLSLIFGGLGLVPLAFPSHQGLILPLWRRWPHRFDGVALSVGAAMPDIVDALVFLLPQHRGGLGQGIGHSLVGVVLLSVPLGLVLTQFVRHIAHAARRSWLEALASPDVSRPWIRGVISVGVGALSHVVFDFVTHANFVLLLPWYESDDFFPSWWSHAWVELPIFVYRKPYPIGPHFVLWVIASAVGIWLFVRCLRRVSAD